MAWFLVYEELGHGDGDDWNIRLRPIPRKIPLKATTHRRAESEAARIWCQMIDEKPFPRLSNKMVHREEELPPEAIYGTRLALKITKDLQRSKSRISAR